jgi:hypothetical protein
MNRRRFAIEYEANSNIESVDVEVVGVDEVSSLDAKSGESERVENQHAPSN